MFFLQSIGYLHFLFFFSFFSLVSLSSLTNNKSPRAAGWQAGRLANSKTRQGNGKAMQAVAEYRRDMPCLPAGATTRLTFVRPVLRSGPAGTNETPDLPTRSAARLVPLRAQACSRIRDRSYIGIGCDKTKSKTRRCNEKNVHCIIYYNGECSRVNYKNMNRKIFLIYYIYWYR